MRQAKYVVFGLNTDTAPDYSPDHPGHESHCLVFAENLNHADVALAYRRAYPGLKPVSAGFVRVEVKRDPDPRTEFEVQCFGHSVSLGISSRGQVDERVVRRSMGLQIDPWAAG